MIEATVDLTIDRPADEVFAFLSDWANNPSWQQGMEACVWTSEPPMRRGSTYDQQARFLGRPIVSSFEVVEYEPGAKVRIVTTSSTMPLDITRSVEALGPSQTRVRALIRGGPLGVARLLDPVIQRMVQRNVTRDYRRLRALLEE